MLVLGAYGGLMGRNYFLMGRADGKSRLIEYDIATGRLV